MAAIAPRSSTIWLLILALGIGCFALRGGFVLLHGWPLEFPPVVDLAVGFPLPGTLFFYLEVVGLLMVIFSPILFGTIAPLLE